MTIEIFDKNDIRRRALDRTSPLIQNFSGDIIYDGTT
jgi:hypothetical protein